MTIKSFKAWVEDFEGARAGDQEMILNFLKSQIHYTDDGTLLGMNTKDMDPKVREALMNRGEISHAGPDIIDMIKNGITVKELIDALARNNSPEPEPIQ